MTVSTETNKNVYVGDGVTVSFAFSFPVLDETHLSVEIKDANGNLSEAAGYTVNGTGNTAGRTNYSSGNVVLNSAPLATDSVTIKRSIPLLQETDYVENDTFPAESHEEALDKLTMISQQAREETDRTLKVDSAVSGFSSTIPSPAANKYLRYNSDATSLEAVALSSEGGIDNVVDDPSPQLGNQLDVNGYAIGDGTRKLIDFVEDPAAVNHIEVENEATGSGPTIRAAGDDTNVDLNIDSKGTGRLVLNGTTGVIGVLDEDDLVSDSAEHIPTQQSVKAYVDARAASQAEQEAGTETGKYVAPATQQYHSSASKAWIQFDGTNTTIIAGWYNIASLIDNGVGDYTVNFLVPFSSADYVVAVSAGNDSWGSLSGFLISPIQSTPNTGKTASSFNVSVMVEGNVSGWIPDVYDVTNVDMVFFGDQ